jgi:hypothetical protein
MTETPLTYRNLFLVLESLGFRRLPTAAATNRHVFCHAPTDTILAYGRHPGELVTAADMLSTEVHLNARGISDERLESLLSAAALGE